MRGGLGGAAPCPPKGKNGSAEGGGGAAARPAGTARPRRRHRGQREDGKGAGDVLGGELLGSPERHRRPPGSYQRLLCSLKGGERDGTGRARVRSAGDRGKKRPQSHRDPAGRPQVPPSPGRGRRGGPGTWVRGFEQKGPALCSEACREVLSAPGRGAGTGQAAGSGCWEKGPGGRAERGETSLPPTVLGSGARAPKGKATPCWRLREDTGPLLLLARAGCRTRRKSYTIFIL